MGAAAAAAATASPPPPVVTQPSAPVTQKEELARKASKDSIKTADPSVEKDASKQAEEKEAAEKKTAEAPAAAVVTEKTAEAEEVKKDSDEKKTLPKEETSASAKQFGLTPGGLSLSEAEQLAASVI